MSEGGSGRQASEVDRERGALCFTRLLLPESSLGTLGSELKHPHSGQLLLRSSVKFIMLSEGVSTQPSWA